jgi:predicted  nucleic acid-binding Zn-ribbon protein
MLGRLFKGGGLEITIKNQTFSFKTVDDFKTFLAAKTEIPASKMKEMLQRTAHHLEEEIKQLSKVEATITEKLAATIRDPKSIDSYLDGATMIRFSQDYDWRQIMFELSKKTTDYSEYKLEAVTYYQQYIRSRISIARSILRDKTGVSEEDDSDKTRILSSTMETRSFSAEEIQQAQEELAASEQQASPQASTSIGLEEQLEDQAASEFERIPRGKTVIVDTRATKMMPLKIASRRFVLDMTQEPPNLISKSGDHYPLTLGENLIGRSTKCSIILNPEFVDISRQHLIIEVYPDNSLHFTDLSSSGTQLPANTIKK